MLSQPKSEECAAPGSEVECLLPLLLSHFPSVSTWNMTKGSIDETLEMANLPTYKDVVISKIF